LAKLADSMVRNKLDERQTTITEQTGEAIEWL